VKEFVSDWYDSVTKQTDSSFDLWISLDSVKPGEVTHWTGRDLRAEWLLVQPGKSPASIRSDAIEYLIENYSAIVFVDSDDILHDSRVAAARATLEVSEMAGCALRLVGQQGRVLGKILGLPPGAKAEDVLPQHNVFGLSNSAYQSSLLRRCLPVPGNVVLVDWFLATRAWLMGARLAFDEVTRMDYRQHGANMARVTYPTSRQQVKRDTELVRQHLELVLASGRAGVLPERLARLKSVALDIERFDQLIVQRPDRFERYVEALNLLDPAPLWWSSVAHPGLKAMWQSGIRN
jgi:hypothetical protein